MKQYIGMWITTAALLFLTGCVSMEQSMFDPGRAEGTDRTHLYHVMKTTWARIDYDEVLLRDVVRDLSAQTGIDFVVNWDDDGFGEGLYPDRTLTLHLRQPTPLIDVLALILTGVSYDEEATWSLGETYVRLGTKEELNRTKYLVIYPADRLIDEGPMFRHMPEGNRQGLKERLGYVMIEDENGNVTCRYDAELADLIEASFHAEEVINILTSLIDPLQWELAGGSGGDIRYLEGVFLVTASDYLHRQLGDYRFPRADRLFAVGASR